MCVKITQETRKYSCMELPKYGLLKTVSRVMLRESKFRVKYSLKEWQEGAHFWKVVSDEKESSQSVLILQLLSILFIAI